MNKLRQVDFRLPREVDVLVWGYPLTDVFLQDALSQGISCKVLDISGKSVNFWCTIFAIWKLLLGRGGLYACYLESASKLFSPKVILTFVDNDWQFWQFSSRGASWRKVIVQNGLRIWPPVSAKFAKALAADLFFCFGEQDEALIADSVGATQILVRGSFRSNREPIIRRKLPIATWISQYESGYKSPQSSSNTGGSAVDGRVELNAIRKFFSWAVAEGLHPRILVRNPLSSANPETNWFTRNLPDYDFDFSSKGKQSPYQHCDQSSICATLDSTLGVEALARGTPVVFFLDRPEYCEGYVFLRSIPEGFKVSADSKALTSKLSEALRAGSQVIGALANTESMSRDEGNGDFWGHIHKIIESDR